MNSIFFIKLYYYIIRALPNCPVGVNEAAHITTTSALRSVYAAQQD